MYFGNNNEYIEEQVILQEFNVSKNDLKDPNYLDKVKKNVENKKEFVEATSVFLTIALSILTGIITSSFLVGIGSFLVFFCIIMVNALKIVNSLPTYDKRRDQIKEKVLKIKDKAEKMKDCKEKQEIIKNCDKVLQEINKQVSKEEDKRRETLINEIRNAYNEIYNIMNNDKYILKIEKGDNNKESYHYSEIEKYLGRLFKIAEYLKISSAKLNNRLMQLSKYRASIKPATIGFKDLFGPVDKDDEDTMTIKPKEYKENSTNYYLIIASDDGVIAYLPSINKIYFGDGINIVDKELHSSYLEIAKDEELGADYDNKEKIMTYLKIVDKYHLIKE